MRRRRSFGSSVPSWNLCVEREIGVGRSGMERKLLAFCRDQGGGVGCADREVNRGTAIAGPGVVDVSFVEATWDLDD